METDKDLKKKYTVEVINAKKRAQKKLDYDFPKR
jgi:hypothetical protein